MSANILELRYALGFKRQTDLVTAQLAADMWSMTKRNQETANLTLATETDAEDVGKGDEFATQSFLTNWDASKRIQDFLSSETHAWATVFACSKVTKTSPDTGAYQYVCVPAVPTTDGIDLFSATYAESIRQGGSAYLDRALIGMCCEGFQVDITSGPGRANAQISIDLVGTGNNVSPSTITAPALTTKHPLSAANSTVLTFNGTDYLANKNLISATYGFRNNTRLNSGFYPGSGTVSGAAVRGRMESGVRQFFGSFRVRLAASSPALAAMLAQTTGTLTITIRGALITGSTYNQSSVVAQKVAYASAVVGNSDGICDVEVSLNPLKHASNGLVTFTTITQTDSIGTSS